MPLGHRKKQFVSYGFVCCQENESYLASVFPKVIPSSSFGMVQLPTNLDRESLYILQTESQSMNAFFLNGKSLTCAKAVECFFREMVLALISP